MTSQGISRGEWGGLGAALLLHAALLAVLLAQPEAVEIKEEAVPEAITVSLADDVGLQSTAPVPVLESRASMGPVLSQVPAPSAGDTAPLFRPAPVERPTMRQPDRSATPAVRTPTARTSAARTSTARRETAQPARSSTPTRSASRSASSANTSTTSSSRSGGASREFSQAFDGAGTSTSSADSRAPASAISGAAKSSLLQSIVRKIRPHWKPPEGADADQLYTNVSFNLNEDGSLSGSPRCSATQGVTAANRTQAAIHCREAMRAVRAAAPFSLPDRFYNAWKSVNDMKFGATL